MGRASLYDNLGLVNLYGLLPPISAAECLRRRLKMDHKEVVRINGIDMFQFEKKGG
jgi:hypothetical protein